MAGKLIFFDIDGTIIDCFGRVPPSAQEAIRKARAAGNRCIINTGRPRFHIDPAVTAIGFDGYVCSCGQHVELDGQVRRHLSLHREVCRAIADKARACRLDAFYESETGLYVDLTHPMWPALHTDLERFRRRGFDVERPVEEAAFYFDKFSVWTGEGSDLDAFLRFVEPWFTPVDRGGGMYEMVRCGCSKAGGMEFMLSLLDARLEDCYAIGDSTNDLPMLACVPHSIAMGNAPDEVKSQVSYVTDTLERDGLAKALAHFGLTE